jgi:hypothetical protein
MGMGLDIESERVDSGRKRWIKVKEMRFSIKGSVQNERKHAVESKVSI